MNGGPRIIITLTPDGMVQLQANIENRVTLYGLLEMAKVALGNQPAQPGIVAASPAALKDLQAVN